MVIPSFLPLCPAHNHHSSRHQGPLSFPLGSLFLSFLMESFLSFLCSLVHFLDLLCPSHLPVPSSLSHPWCPSLHLSLPLASSPALFAQAVSPSTLPIIVFPTPGCAETASELSEVAALHTDSIPVLHGHNFQSPQKKNPTLLLSF